MRTMKQTVIVLEKNSELLEIRAGKQRIIISVDTDRHVGEHPPTLIVDFPDGADMIVISPEADTPENAALMEHPLPKNTTVFI